MISDKIVAYKKYLENLEKKEKKNILITRC